MTKKALIVWGGWDGHEPQKVAGIFGKVLEEAGFEVTVSDTLKSLEDAAFVKSLHLLVPIWTCGKIEHAQEESVSEAVANGTGIAGCHGGMCDAFREAVNWQFITGGQWVSHPGGDGVEYKVRLKRGGMLMDGIPDFTVKSEHYYLHVDPAVTVHAVTKFPVAKWFHSSNGEVDMPVAWTKRWGAGRVFYNSLGHHGDVFDAPEPLEMMRRGMVWAAAGKDEAIATGACADDFRSDKKMF